MIVLLCSTCDVLVSRSMKRGIMEIKVSVILPSLNVADYIRECLNSVISQTLQEIEIVCVDAGSTDGTFEIIQEYARNDSRVRVINSAIKSYGKQVNEGILSAKGKYIAIVETDDYIAEGMLKELYTLAEEYSLDYVKADFDAFVELQNGGRVWQVMKTLPLDHDLYGKVVMPQLYTHIYVGDHNIWKGIYRKDFLDQHEIKFNETPGAAFQDIGFLLQTLCLAHRAMYLEDTYYRYRMYRKGASTYTNTVVQFLYQEYSRLLDGNIFPAQMDKQIWRNLYFKLALSFPGEYDKVLHFEQYQTNSPSLLKYYEWFKGKIQKAMTEGLINFEDFNQYNRFELQLLLKSADSYADYKYIKDFMKKELIDQLLSKIQDCQVVIFGCGKYGKELCMNLDMQGIETVAFYDNNEELWGKEYGGIKILKPKKQDNEEVMYIVASKLHAEEIKRQLEMLGIDKKHII